MVRGNLCSPYHSPGHQPGVLQNPAGKPWPEGPPQAHKEEDASTDYYPWRGMLG